MPPATTEDATVWDSHWQGLLESGLIDAGVILFDDMFVHDRDFIAFLQHNNVRRVLCAGNGISQEPKALAAAGLEVTALDFSSIATRICEEMAFGDEYRRRLLDDDLVRPGGSVTYIVGDIMDPTICPGPHDLIIERKTAQLFEGPKMDDALAALAQRLAEPGVFFSHCHDACGRPGDPRKPRTERWFREQGWPIWGDKTPENAGLPSRIAWALLSTG